MENNRIARYLNMHKVKLILDLVSLKIPFSFAFRAGNAQLLLRDLEIIEREKCTIFLYLALAVFLLLGSQQSMLANIHPSVPG